MDQEQLKASLKGLHKQLANTEEVDHELQHLLAVLNSDIEQILDKEDEREADANTFGLAGRARELTARFAAQHPTLEPTLRELARILGNMGI
ncbi:MAG: DUF4404 family protein [Burkholderiales bacterium]|nr:DUF4404 family protein [Burkholderiales bacterium]